MNAGGDVGAEKCNNQLGVGLSGTAKLAMVSHGHGIEGKRAPRVLEQKDERNAHFGGVGAVVDDPGSSFGPRMTGQAFSGPGQRQD